MNRTQAEHILDAYIELELDESGKPQTAAIKALREVILDAMTQYKGSTFGISAPCRPPGTLVACSGTKETVQDGTTVTCSGVDPAFTRTTSRNL